MIKKKSGKSKMFMSKPFDTGTLFTVFFTFKENKMGI